MKRIILTLAFLGLLLSLQAQENTNQNKFKQLGQELPTPNAFRNASGAPGHAYWQQQADYIIKMKLDDEAQKMYGEETITYHNQSPDNLDYLWLQLDQNMRAKDSDTYKIRNSKISDKMSLRQLGRLDSDFEGGFNIEYVKDATDKSLNYVINKTMMRVDPPNTIKPGESYTFKVKWWYNINNTNEMGGRSGYEPFVEEDGSTNNVYCISQFFPRMCVYDDVNGWQNKQFLGRGEFALSFGDYDVYVTVPDDHLVAATGELQNADKVLTRAQRNRLKEAMKNYEQPVTIATYEEADERIEEKSTKMKTWHFKAENVRDFGFATSRRFIWDAMGVPMSDGRTVMASSMWIKEGDCLLFFSV